MNKKQVWFYYGVNKLLNTISAGVATSKEEAEKQAEEWLDEWKVDSKVLEFDFDKVGTGE